MQKLLLDKENGLQGKERAEWMRRYLQTAHLKGADVRHTQGTQLNSKKTNDPI